MCSKRTAKCCDSCRVDGPGQRSGELLEDRRDETIDWLAVRYVDSSPVSTTSFGLFGPTYRALTIGLVAIVTLVAFESLAVVTVMPEIEAQLDGLAWYGWVTTAFFLGTLTGIVFAGGQADR